MSEKDTRTVSRFFGGEDSVFGTMFPKKNDPKPADAKPEESPDPVKAEESATSAKTESAESAAKPEGTTTSTEVASESTKPAEVTSEPAKPASESAESEKIRVTDVVDRGATESAKAEADAASREYALEAAKKAVAKPQVIELGGPTDSTSDDPVSSQNSTPANPDSASAPASTRDVTDEIADLIAAHPNDAFRYEVNIAEPNARAQLIRRSTAPSSRAEPIAISVIFRDGDKEYYSAPIRPDTPVTQYPVEARMLCRSFAATFTKARGFAEIAEKSGISYIPIIRECILVYVDQNSGQVYTQTPARLIPGLVTDLRPIDPISSTILVDELPTQEEWDHWYAQHN